MREGVKGKKRKAKKKRRRTSTFIDLLFFKHRILGNGFIMSSRRVNADCPGIIRFVVHGMRSNSTREERTIF